MNVSRFILGFVVLIALISTQPALSAVSEGSDPDAIYTIRVERGKSNRVQFRLMEPRGDSVIEAEQLDFILTKKGLVIKPAPTALATGTAGQLLFDNFQLLLPNDGSEPMMEGEVPR